MCCSSYPFSEHVTGVRRRYGQRLMRNNFVIREGESNGLRGPPSGIAFAAKRPPIWNLLKAKLDYIKLPENWATCTLFQVDRCELGRRRMLRVAPYRRFSNDKLGCLLTFNFDDSAGFLGRVWRSFIRSGLCPLLLCKTIASFYKRC